MTIVKRSFKCKGTEYTIVRMGDRPFIVESVRLREALQKRAECYPEVCALNHFCGLEIPEEHLPMLHEELDWIS